MSLLDVTDRDIAHLNDEDLRSLVALLCEATVRQFGQPCSAVTWGGSQDAADGGIDVRVDLTPDAPVGGFLPRPATGVQVKKPNMTPAAIRAEMRPGGLLRPTIRALAAQGGAYVIASSGAHLTDSALANRRVAMRAAVADLPGSGRLALDFYDRQRLATWVRDHPGLVPWVRAKAGRPIIGWQSHGAWSSAPDGKEGEYLLDDGMRLHGVVDGGQRELSATAGLDAVRGLLAKAGRVVRLVGLSGVGKTRFLQALFDARLGAGALDPALAIYTNLSDGPEPQPVAMATLLIAQRHRVVLVVDNCAADLHGRLSELVRAVGSTIGVVTVEYDVADDQPEGTEVFRLEPASAEIIGRLVQQRFPEMSTVNVDTIADNSGGNARIAIALAHTVGRGENLAGLPDRDLFLRLFEQRNPHDAQLLAAAEACSLLYSFDGETLTGDEAELPALAALTGLSIHDVFSHVAELKRRDLVQNRGRWRAVLPHAIANRLAERALERMSISDIQARLVRNGSERMARSFSRRLGYLHRSAAAVRIAQDWLTPSGLLGDAASLNELGYAMLANIAPLAPGAALACLERAAVGPAGAGLFSNTAGRHSRLTRLVRSLAYEPDLFERSADLLIRASLAEEPDNKDNSVADLFSSLFPLLLSGTRATAEQRLRVVESLLRSEEARRQALGLRALDAALEAHHFSSVYSFSFGARVRDHGYQPRAQADVLHWFGLFVQSCQQIGCSGLPVAPCVRQLLARRFHGLWAASCACDALERAARAFSAQGRWDEGWMAVRQTLGLHRGDLESGRRERLQALAALLAPRSLAERVGAYVLSSRSPMYDGTDDNAEDETTSSIARSFQRAQSNIEALGRELACTPEVFNQLRPSLVRHRDDATPLWHLGKGLGEAATDPEAMWQSLVDELCQAPEAGACPSLLRGFLSGLQPREPERVAAILDAAVSQDGLTRWFPSLQTSMTLDHPGITRLHRSLQVDVAPILSYSGLSYCDFVDAAAGSELAHLAEAIGVQPGGMAVALDILAMHLRSDRRNGGNDQVLVATGRRLLRLLADAVPLRRQGYMLAELVAECTSGSDGEDVARHLCTLIRGTAGSSDLGHHAREIMGVLFRTQPGVALTTFLEDGGTEEDVLGRSLFEHLEEFGPNPLSEVPSDAILAWCHVDAPTRFPLAATVVRYEDLTGEGTGPSWTGIALRLMEQAPDRLTVLQRFTERFRPRAWSGSRAAILSRRCQLLAVFEQDGDERVAAYAQTERGGLERDADQGRQWEADHSRARDEAFE